MLQVLLSAPTPRILYSLEVVFTHVLGVEYQWVGSGDFQPEDGKVVVDYAHAGVPGAILVPESGFLMREDLGEIHFSLVYEDELPVLFAEEQPEEGESLGFDLFSAVFYLVTEYEKWISPRFDGHGRYEEGAYLSLMQKWHHKPLVHAYCGLLWEKIAPLLPADSRNPRPFDFHLTFDIDNPWKYLHKPLWVTAGGMGKKLLNGDLEAFKEQVNALRSRRDPYDTFSLIFRHCPPEKTTLFFLGGGHSPFDGRFTFRQKPLQKLIMECSNRGYGIGLHPSYQTMEDAQLLRSEKNALEKVTGFGIIRSRQHFLRYRYPDTFQNLLLEGIREDYSLGLSGDVGFRTHITVPYPWFDLETNRTTGLMLHPTHAMDRTLQHYLKTSPEEGLSRLLALKEEVKKTGGVFTLLLHNDALSESGEWKGWRAPLLDFISELTGEK